MVQIYIKNYNPVDVVFEVSYGSISLITSRPGGRHTVCSCNCDIVHETEARRCILVGFQVTNSDIFTTVGLLTSPQ